MILPLSTEQNQLMESKSYHYTALKLSYDKWNEKNEARRLQHGARFRKSTRKAEGRLSLAFKRNLHGHSDEDYEDIVESNSSNDYDDYDDLTNDINPSQLDLPTAISNEMPFDVVRNIIITQFGGTRGFENQFGSPLLHFLVLEMNASASYISQLLSEQEDFSAKVVNPKKLDDIGLGVSALMRLWELHRSSFGKDLKEAPLSECQRLYEMTMLLRMYETELSKKEIASYILCSWDKFYSSKPR